ncbi:MAG: hypothetical protein QNM00_22640, partial [Gammaproteobacteria bacterium]|nr:hypothetical protein [Gammaproteobacteria bacterium]
PRYPHVSGCRRLAGALGFPIRYPLIGAYTTFIVAEHHLHVSGVITVMVAGMTIGRYTSRRITAAQRDFFKELWGYASVDA